MRWKYILGVLLLWCTTGWGITFSLPDTSMTLPDYSLVTLPIYIDVDPGEGVRSMEIELDAPNNWEMTAVTTGGSLSESWGADVAWECQDDGMLIAVASDDAMAGIGVLCYFSAMVHESGNLRFLNALANEGAISVITNNGYFTRQNPPVLTLYPGGDYSLLIGDDLDYDISGSSAPPIAWTVENPLTGEVTTDGVFTALAQGLNRVHAEDAAGTAGSGGLLTIHTFRLSVENAYFTAGEEFVVSLNLDNPANAPFTSYEFALEWNVDNRFTFQGLETAGTLSGGWTELFTQTGDNRVLVASSSSDGTAINGAGTLVQLRFSSTTGTGYNALLSLNEVHLDEDYWLLTENGYAYCTGSNAFTITPNTMHLKRGETGGFGYSGTPNGTLDWYVIDPIVGSINNSGLFTALGGGATRVFAVDDLGERDTTGIISVYDLDVWLYNQLAQPEEVIRIPVYTDSVNLDEVISFEFTLEYDPGIITFLDVDNAFTLTESWSDIVTRTDGDELLVGGAGAPITSSGPILIYLVFEVDPLSYPGQVSPLTFTDFLYNEGQPVTEWSNAQLTVIPEPVHLYIHLSGNNAVLDWGAFFGAAYYNVYRSTEPYSGFVKVAETTSLTWTDSGAATTWPQRFYYVTAEVP